jgi:hypothetical protein
MASVPRPPTTDRPIGSPSTSAPGRLTCGTPVRPGEEVPIETALRLAFALYNRQQAGYDLQTLFWDEFDGAMSLDNKRRYMSLLRSALEIGGFDRIYLVSHTPEVYEQCDARLVFHGGQVEVEA